MANKRKDDVRTIRWDILVDDEVVLHAYSESGAAAVSELTKQQHPKSKVEVRAGR